MRFASLLASILLLLCGCSKTQNPAAPEQPRTLRGIVRLFDSDGNELTDRSQVSATLDGTSETTSSTSGDWTFSGILEPAHTIEFTKAGFGPVKRYLDLRLEELGVDTIRMSQQPSFQLSLSSGLFLTDSNALMVTGSASVGNLQEAVALLCISKQPSVDTSAAACIVITVAGSTFSVVGPSARALEHSGFHPGETAYVALYPLGWHNDAYSAYFDPSASKYVYSALGNRSQVLTIQIP